MKFLRSLAVLICALAGCEQKLPPEIADLIQRGEQGDAESQHTLGDRYQDGDGVTQDYVKAVKWYRLAAEQGDADAQYSLGAMYDSGQGVAQDLVQAHMWLSLAVSTASPYDPKSLPRHETPSPTR